MASREIEPNAQHVEFRKKMDVIFGEHCAKYPNCDASELLALAAQAVGQLLALQDKNTMTPARGIAIIQANIEAGNAHAITAHALGKLKPS